MARYDGLTLEEALELVPAVAAVTGGLRCIGRYLMQRGDIIPSVTVRDIQVFRFKMEPSKWVNNNNTHLHYAVIAVINYTDYS